MFYFLFFLLLTGDRFFSGLGVDRNPRLAFRSYLAAAEAGLVRAMNSVGCLHLRGTGVPVNTEEAQRWFRKSSEQGDQEGAYLLATLLDDRVASSRRRLLLHTRSNDEAYRVAVVRTMREIESLLLRASKAGHSASMNALGSLCVSIFIFLFPFYSSSCF